MDIEARAYQLMLQGNCCAQVMVRLALEERGEENERMVEVLRVLCRGMFSGIGCGALEGGAMALAILADRPVDGVIVDEFVDWFRRRYETTDCEALTGHDIMARYVDCPRMITEAYKEAREILDALGFLPM